MVSCYVIADPGGTAIKLRSLLDPEPILVQTYLPDDHCHGADMPVIQRVWYHPIADEL